MRLRSLVKVYLYKNIGKVFKQQLISRDFSMQAYEVPKVLVALDYDQTVVGKIVDLEVKKLCSLPIPEKVESLYCNHSGWTSYMGEIFSLLHNSGVQKQHIQTTVLSVPFVSGMKELFTFLNHDDRFEVIIISDSNTVFIDWSMQDNDIHSQVDGVYSNPARFNEDGRLTIHPYHHQNWCKLSTSNLCKGHILESHINERKAAGVSYSNVAYIGDGGNDYCPAIRLSANDYVFPREGFTLAKMLDKDSSEVKAKILPWSNGTDIIDSLRKFM